MEIDADLDGDIVPCSIVAWEKEWIGSKLGKNGYAGVVQIVENTN